MLKTRKKFDCVRMKQEIQEQILEEYKGLSSEKARERKRKEIEKDPVLGPVLRRIKRVASQRAKS